MNKLESPPKYLRSAPEKQTGAAIAREGGLNRAGAIRGLSVITSGEALGHDVWIDDVFLDQVTDSLNERNAGHKARFAHPGLSSDGLGKHVGRAMSANRAGDQVLADVHFVQSSHSTPDGDLATYLMDLAEEDPEALGMSIVFMHDLEAQDRYTLEQLDENGNFVSPDALNTKNLPHARLAELRAVDFVDEPAANPNGLFHRGHEIPEEAFAVADYALGLIEDKPAELSLGIDSDRLRGFVGRYLSTRNIEVTKMAADTKETPPVETPDELTAQTEPETTAPVEDSRAEAARYREAFGDQGAVWYSEGKEFEECRTLEVADLRNSFEALQEENELLKQKLSAVDAGEDEPAELGGEDEVRESFVRFNSPPPRKRA